MHKTKAENDSFELDDHLIYTKDFLNVVLKKIHGNKLCLYDSSTNEKIKIDCNLNRLVKVFYEDKLRSMELNE